MRLDMNQFIGTKHPRLNAVYRAVREMSNEGFSGQDEIWRQLVDVSGFASLLAARRGGDHELAAVTGLLHGYYLYRTGIKHFPGPNSADAARQLLRGVQLWSDDELFTILQAIFYQGVYRQAQGPYEKMLNDAVLMQNVFSPVTNRSEQYITHIEQGRLDQVLQELGMTNEIKIENVGMSTETGTGAVQHHQERRRLELADYAERLAKQGIIGISEDEHFRKICRYWPDSNIYTVLKANWCAAFVYHCCMQVCIQLPIRYPNQSYRLAGVGAWLDWSRLPETGFFHEDRQDGFEPERGDLVVYEKLLTDDSHDHIGIVLSCEGEVLIVAEGNVDNLNYSGIVTRSRAHCILGYIRISDDYQYDFQGEYHPI
ncbi:hypothetical protein GCM10008014_13850 [Paenibacillus silvae]|uniref:Peptidase C51 domain-containing protein n=1 Tax=Paenibacillus silvae TaxID=1325358 RepID=A0ABQ1Z4Y7_9BACL|nr:CHAP domain-containing protein [Paenibacillus silvae]GGH49400.1 hypothetical protein GCM10008014_13850 [Paenibacillus silvae]